MLDYLRLCKNQTDDLFFYNFLYLKAEWLTTTMSDRKLSGNPTFKVNNQGFKKRTLSKRKC